MKTQPVEKALAFLRHQLDTGIWKTGHRLPQGRKLAELADVGYASMLKALDILKTKKRVSIKRKKGIFAGHEIPQSPKKQTHKKKFEKIKERIHNDCVVGTFHNREALPSVKELSIHYQADFTVIKKAIEMLMDEGLLHQEKKRYRIVRYTKTTSDNVIYFFILENDYTGVWHFARDWSITFIRTLEMACHERAISLIKIYYSASGQKPTPVDMQRALGSIIYPFGDQNILDVLTFVRKFNHPAVLVIGPTFFQWPDSFTAAQKTGTTNFFFSDSKINKDAGWKVGQMLLSRGHTKVCFFAPKADSPIYMERYRGLCDCFSSAGLAQSAIHLVAPEADPENRRIHDNPTHLQVKVDQLKDELGTGYSFTKEMVPTDLITHFYVKYRKLYFKLRDMPNSEQTIEMPADQVSNDIAEAVLAVNKMRLPALFKSPVTATINETINAVELHLRFFPLFQKALAIPGVTAWVCAEDNLTNAAAFEFLKQKNIKIPEQLGLIGFQDHYESCTNNISSYHFDFAKTALKALSLVTHPKHSAKLFCKKDSGEFAFEGMVIDRGSV